MSLDTQTKNYKSDARNSGPAVASDPINVVGADQVLAHTARGVYCGGAGNLVCRLVGADADTTFTGLLAGNYYPFAVSIIRQTGTTITNSVVLY